jgi:hypothetical protein
VNSRQDKPKKILGGTMRQISLSIDSVRVRPPIGLRTTPAKCVRRSRDRFLPAALALFAFLCAGAPAAYAQFTCTWTDASDNWTTVGDWSGCNSTFPNNGGGNTYNAMISTGDPTLTTTITIGSVTITSPGVWSITGTGEVTLIGGVTNGGSLFVDVGPGDGGGSLTVGGTLANTGAVQMGSIDLNAGAANSMTLGALTNASGASFDVFGSTAHPATLAFTGTGFSQNNGTFELFNTTALTLNNAFTNSTGATFELGATAPLTVTGNYGNGGSLFVDVGPGDGGGSLTVGGTLANTGAVQMGSIDLNAGAANSMTLGALTNASGASFDVFGSAANQATVNIVAASGATASNAGTLSLQEHVGFNTSAGVNLSNSSTFSVDSGSGTGSSTVSVGGTLSNTAILNIGNTNLSAPTTVTAAALTNSGTIGVTGNSSNAANQASVTVNGAAGNSGTVNIATNAAVTVTGAGNAYTQTAGFTNLSGGTLAGPNINISGGALQGMGTVTGALNISGTGSIQAINLANNALAAVLSVNGNYAQSGGTFDALLHGTGTQIDAVAVGGGDSVHLTGGNLQVSGVAFALGQMFNDIMTFTPNDLSGTFATLQGGGNGNMVNLGGGLTLEALYNNSAGNISLEVVPTPPGEIWIDATGNWTTDTAKWSQNRAPIPTDDVTIGSTDNGNVTLNNDATINSLTINPSNALTNTSGTTLTVSAAVGNSGSLTLGGNLTATGAVTNNTGATLTMQGGTLSAASFTNAGTTSGFGTINPAIANTGLVQASGGTLTAQGGIQGTGNITVDPAATLAIGANSTVGTLTQNGTLNLGANNITGSSDYVPQNFSSSNSGNSFNKLAGVTGTGQILAAGPTPANMEVITGPDVTNGNTTTPTLGLGILHVGDSTTYQIANEGTTANPSLRGAIQTDVSGGNITGNLLSGTGITATNFGPIAPGTSTTNYTVTAANPGLLSGQAVHFANNFGNVPEQTMSITGQVNLFAKLALEQTGGDGKLTGGGTSYDLDFGNVVRGSPTQEALLAILNDNPLAEQAFTDLLSTNPTGSAAPFDLMGCSVRGLPGGDGQSCDVLFDANSLGKFMDIVTFDIESSNSSGYDQVIGDVTLNLEGDVVPPTVPEPGSIALLASGLFMLFFVVRRERRGR